MSVRLIPWNCPECGCGCNYALLYVTMEKRFSTRGEPSSGTASGYFHTPCQGADPDDCFIDDYTNPSFNWLVWYPDEDSFVGYYGPFVSLDTSKTLCFSTWNEALDALGAMPRNEKIIST